MARAPELHDFIFCNSEHGLCECGEPRDAEIHCANKECRHDVLRKSRRLYAENLYVCGQCACRFVVTAKEPESRVAQPAMFDRRKPWGLRNRQA